MSAEVLRRAAALMRERAETATPGPWVPHVRSVDPEASHPHVGWVSTRGNRMTVVENAWDGDVVYIAAMSPLVALAVADSLDVAARSFGSPGHRDWHGPEAAALAIARAYLGATP